MGCIEFAILIFSFLLLKDGIGQDKVIFNDSVMLFI